MVPDTRLACAAIFGGALTAMTFWVAGAARAQDGFEPVISGDTVKMLTSRDLLPSQFTPLKQLSAVSCRRSFVDHRPSEHDAIIELQRQAYQAGADALLDTRCRTSDTADLLNNCWQSVECIGTAITLNTAKGAPDGGPAVSTGSGFVVSKSGHVLTNAHVVEGCESTTGQLPSGQFPLTIVNVDKQNDLAILQTEFKVPAVATF